MKWGKMVGRFGEVFTLFLVGLALWEETMTAAHHHR
jgi:hypothetical protein